MVVVGLVVTWLVVDGRFILEEVIIVARVLALGVDKLVVGGALVGMSLQSDN